MELLWSLDYCMVQFKKFDTVLKFGPLTHLYLDIAQPKISRLLNLWVLEIRFSKNLWFCRVVLKTPKPMIIIFFFSVLYFAWNLLTILVLICWSIVTTLIFFGPLAYFDLLGRIPDSNDETVEMREIVATDETFKKGIEKNLLIYWL